VHELSKKRTPNFSAARGARDRSAIAARRCATVDRFDRRWSRARADCGRFRCRSANESSACGSNLRFWSADFDFASSTVTLAVAIAVADRAVPRGDGVHLASSTNGSVHSTVFRRSSASGFSPARRRVRCAVNSRSSDVVITHRVLQSTIRNRGIAHRSSLIVHRSGGSRTAVAVESRERRAARRESRGAS
jgi:hypothetical protein